MTAQQVYSTFQQLLLADPEFGPGLGVVSSLAGVVLGDQERVVRQLDRFVTLYGRSRGFELELRSLE